MLKLDETYSTYAITDAAAAHDFYVGLLGFAADEVMGGLSLDIGGGKHVLLYPKQQHEPATFTVLNIPTDDIDAAVAGLRAKGVTFEQYEGMTGEDGIARGRSIGMGPDIAWFRDPAGNILSVQQGD
jgi:catechol 2,3-dioxygenase-like lactoylglutathione lyase family enzyme